MITVTTYQSHKGTSLLHIYVLKRWYTSMLGKKASVRSIKSELLRNKVVMLTLLCIRYITDHFHRYLLL